MASKNKSKRSKLFLAALEEFGKLRHTPGAPLEYLGKSLVYKALQDLEEECKCLELAIRKYPSHPLSHTIVDHIVFRLQESSSKDRKATYHFALLCLRHIPSIFENEGNKSLLQSLDLHIEKPLFLKEMPKGNLSLSILLAFWLAKPISLIEILEQLSSEAEENMPYLLGTIFSLVHLGYEDWAEENTYFLRNTEIYPLLHLYFSSWKKDPKGCLDTFFSSSFSPFSLLHLETLSLIIERCIKKKKTLKALSYFEKLPKVLPAEYQMHIDELHLTLLLLEKKKKQAEGIFSKYTIETIAKENSPLRTLYGCFLGITKGKKKALDFLCSTSQKLYPKTKNLLSHFVAGYCSPSWEDSAFYAEKKELYKQLFLYYHSIQNPIEEKKVANLLRKYQKASLGD